MLRASLLFAAMTLGTTAVHASDTSAYTHQIEQWRADRVARLTAPDGWLSLIGLEWLHEGANRIGSAADNDIVLKAGPAHLGTLALAPDGNMHMALAKDAGATIDGKPVTEATLVDDVHAGANGPTIVRFGSASFYVIDRDGRKALRVKDPEAPTRAHFAGIDYFPIDPSWRIEADWEPFAPGHKLEIGSVIGTI